MNLPRKKRDEVSASITQTMWLIVVCSGLFVLTSYATPPSWWSSPGSGTQGAVVPPQVVTNDGIVTTNYVSNDYAVVTQGQLKQFTARAVDELNTNLPNVGGAGTTLTNLVYDWHEEYLTNGYNATNHPPSDYEVINVGQLKYIGNLVWGQLVAAGYTNAAPSWLAQNTNSDNAVANVGQLKEVFDFDLSDYLAPVITSSTNATGASGTAFSYTITATNDPMNFNATGLPAGLSVNTSSGVISGTPTAVGPAAVGLSASNGAGTGTATLALTVTPAAPVISSATTASGNVGVAFNYTIAASNSPTSFNATSLPSGLSVNTSTGVISGTPTTTGTNSVGLSATNAGGTGTATLTLTVNASVPVISSSNTATGTVGSSFSYTITASSSPTSYGASGLPTGLVLNPSTGAITGTPTASGTYTVALSATNSQGTGSATLTLTVNPATPVINSATTATGSKGGAFSYTITASNSPTSFNATSLPSGLSVNTSTGVISGTPTATSTNSVALSASNVTGTGTATLALTVNAVPVITSSNTFTRTVGESVSYTITATSSPTSFNATGLPSGLSVDTSTGLISGTLATVGTSLVTISATNSSGTGSAIVSLTVNPKTPNINSANTATGTVGTSFSYTITADSVPTSFNATGLPSGLSVDTSAGVISGTPTVTGSNTVSLSASNVSGTGTAMLHLTIASGAPVIESATTADGQTGTSFSYGIIASNSPTSYNATNLPSGLSVDTSSGVISGTATATGTNSVSLSASNVSGTGTATLTLKMASGAVPVISSTNTASGTVGSAFSYTITASDSPTSYDATGLPSGLSVNTSSGVISGTPAEAAVGTSWVTLKAINSNNRTGTATLQLTIGNAAPMISSTNTASGTVGSAFSFTVTASNSPTSFNASGLPTGLMLNTSTGAITGTPTVSGTSTVALIATNTYGTGAATLTLTVNPATPVITSATSATGSKGGAFSYTITASNSPTSFNATSLPSGLSVNTSTGVISGTPTATGTNSVALSASNVTGTGTATLALTVNSVPAITSSNTAVGTVGSSFSYTIAASNSPTSYNATGLPSGLSVNTSTGAISGTPTAAGTSAVTISATNSSGTGSAVLTLTVNPPAPVISSSTTASGTTSSAFIYTIAASNSPTSFSATGLPSGLSINTSTGVISGTPAASGTNSVTLGATNAGGTGTATLALTINPGVPFITSANTYTGVTSTAFSYTIMATNSPTSFGESGLPAGLTLNPSTGVISGTPTASGTSTVTLTATNASGTGSLTLTLIISTPPKPVITSSTTASATVETGFSYAITANNAPTSFSASGLPSGLSFNSSTGVINGTPATADTYSVALGAINAGGTGTATLTLTVSNPSAPVIVPSSTTVSGDVGVAFSYTITASNNPVSFSASGLPPGLSLDAGSGVISGTPTATGTSTVTLNASNAGGTGSATLTLTIEGPGAPVITSPTTAEAFNTSLFTTASAFSYPITATSNPTSYSATGLPSGLSVSTSTGVISGTPTATNTFTSSVAISAANSSGTGSAILTLSVNSPVPAITSSTTATGTVGSEFIFGVTASNSPTSFSATGLPPGLSIDPNTGVISGTPTVASTTPWTVALSAANAGGSGSTAYLTLTIGNPVPPPIITSSTLATGDAGVAFSYAITTTTGAPPPSSYGATPLPSGLSINTSTGVISGTPSTPGTSTVTLSATNGWGTTIETLTLIITPAGSPVITSATTATGMVGSTYTDLYAITATNSPTSYSASGLPAGLSINTSNGHISGTPEVAATSAVVLGATNSDGTGQSILTLTINPPAPVITSASSASGTFGVAFTPYTITATNSPTSFSASGLPPGLLLDTVTGVISGTPTEAGNFTVTLGATNAGGTGLADLAIDVSSGSGQPILTRSIATGYNNTLVLKSDGTVWAAGNNFNGELGNGGSANSDVYTKVSGFPSGTVIVAVAESYDQSYALTSTGTVYAWGYGYDGELGNGTNGESSVPVQVTTSGDSTLSDIIAISSGYAGAMALRNDGTVWTWGYGGDGTLGNGTNDTSDVAVQVVTSSGPLGTTTNPVVGIACGASHDLAVRSDGTVWAWGYDGDGELGDAGMIYGTTNSNVAVEVPLSLASGTIITSIAGGRTYSVATASDGTVWAWGDESGGYLGNGIMGSGLITGPVQVLNSTGGSLSNVVSVSSQGDHTLALKNDGTVWAWGENENGQLGDGTVGANSPFPVQVSNLSGVIAISAGYSSNTALESDGSIWGWGYNGDDSDIGAGGAATPTALPATVPNLTGIKAIAAAKSHYLALDSNGNVWTWDDTTPGEISDGVTVTGSSTPVQVQGLSGITAIACGSYFNLALDSNNTVWAWGDNSYGELGNGSFTPQVDATSANEAGIDPAPQTVSQTPAPVMTMSGGNLVPLSSITTITAIACGGYNSVALDNTGKIWTWGLNVEGELGNGNYTTTNVAGPVSSTNTFTAIAAGADHVIALQSNHTVWAWGTDFWGELGNGATGNGDELLSNVPVQVSGLSGITAVASGYFHSMALDSSSNVWTWGLNEDGELGNGTTTNTDTPAKISSLSGITAIQSGMDSYHCAALEVSGTNQTLWTWGSNISGQLGVGTFGPVGSGTNASPTGSTIPVQVIGLSGVTVTALACGKYSTVALTSTGTVLQWGDNSYEPLGFSVPIQVAGPQTNPPPVISPAGGVFSSSQSVTITNSLGSGNIFYTEDGTEPTTSSAEYTTGIPFTLTADALVSAAIFSTSGTIETPIATSQFYINDTNQTGLADLVTYLSASVASSGNAIDLSWSPGSLVDYSEIDIYRSANGGDYQLIAVLPSSASCYVDTNVQSGVNYQYKVGTFDASGINDTSATTAVFTTASTVTITVTTPSDATNYPP